MTDEYTKAAWAHIGRWIKAKRDLTGRSRREVNELGGPSISTQQQIEDGGRQYRGEWVLPSPDARTWGRLLAVLDADLDDLIYEGELVNLWERETFPVEETERHRSALAGDLWVNDLGPGAAPKRLDMIPATEERELLSAVRALTEVVRELRDEMRQSRREGSPPPA